MSTRSRNTKKSIRSACCNKQARRWAAHAHYCTIITNSHKDLGSYQRWHYILMPLPVGFIRYSFLCRFEEVQVFILVRIPSPCVRPTMGPGHGWDNRIWRIQCQEYDT